MKKIFVFLGLSLLCWGSSFAQERETSTQVDPEAIQSYSDLTTVIKNIADAPVLKNKYDAAVTEYNRVSAIPEPPEKIWVDVQVETKKTSPLVTAINNFVTSKNAADESGIITPNELSYRIRVIKADRFSKPVFYLYVTYPDYTSTVDENMTDTETTNSFNKWKDEKWTTTDMTTLRNALTDESVTEIPYNLERTEGSTVNATPRQMIVCYPKYEKNGNTVSETYTAMPITQSESENITYFFQSSWIDKLSAIASTPNQYGLEVTFTETKPEERDNSAAVSKWEQDIANAKTAMENAEAAWKAINKGDFYLNAANVFKITSNFEVPANKTNLTWPADRTLDGGCHKITGNVPLIYLNYGEIHDLIAPEGRVVDRNINLGVTPDCISKQSDTEWRIYDKDGYKSYTTLKTAVYQLRDKFGFNVETNEATGPADRTTKLYEAKYTDAKHKDLYTFHVNLAENDGAEAFKYNKAQAASDNRLASGIKRENTVIYINNADVPADVKAWINVATRNNVETEKYTCENVELIDGEKDGKETEEFYVPTGFAFKNIHYGRKFNQNMTALCLPFKLDANVKSALKAKLDPKQEIWYYTFKEVKGKTMWFNVTNEVEANTPCIIAYSGEPLQEGNAIFDALNLDGTTLPEFVSTNGATLGATASNTGELCFFGNYKFGQFANNLQALANGGKGSCIYGFQAGELRLMPEATEKDGELVGPRLHQFRSYIRLEADLTGNTAAPNSFNIGLLDEDGNVVTGIESVESGKEANGFKAVGGNSAIEISTDKACEVKVYTASGSLVKAVRVEAGNTTLPFGAGMYIVNQTKVVVK
ncbi:MAG: hypothetical protein J6B92_04565 [Paraprevotella sp.]|nr:hypothetical protein [Paraprevotella sp.]MBP3472041.1 hypothetical protein [Paraprevotella sp.]